MESIQRSVAVSQISTNINNIQSEPSLHGIGQTRSHSISSSSHRPYRSPADERTIDRWIQNLPQDFRPVDEGVMKELMSLALRYFEEFRVAHYQEASSVFELLEQHQMLHLWADGDSDLDRRLNEAPAERGLMVSHLTALVMILSTGTGLCRPKFRQNLVKDTNRVVEQASKIALDHLKRAESCPPVTILEFCNARKNEIASRIYDLYDLLPMTQRVVPDFEETEPRQVEEIGHDHRRPSLYGHFKRIGQKFRRPSFTNTPADGSSSTSRGAKYSRKLRFSTKQSNSTDSPSISSLFSHDDTHHSAHPLTDTITSNPPSEATECSSELTYCKTCKTKFSEHVDFENHDCHTIMIKPWQLVNVWHHGDRDPERKPEVYLAEIDTGTSENFISRSAVEKLNLEITRKDPITFSPFGDTFEVSESVQPKWQFRGRSKVHDDFRFWVVPKISGDTKMLLGNIAKDQLGIHLRAYENALVAHEDREGLSTLDQQKKRDRQARDVTASQAKTRQRLEAEHKRLVQQMNAANAANAVNVTKPRDSTSQKNATGLSNNQRQ